MVEIGSLEHSDFSFAQRVWNRFRRVLSGTELHATTPDNGFGCSGTEASLASHTGALRCQRRSPSCQACPQAASWHGLAVLDKPNLFQLGVAQASLATGQRVCQARPAPAWLGLAQPPIAWRQGDKGSLQILNMNNRRKPREMHMNLFREFVPRLIRLGTNSSKQI